jgi:hypothetical protein
MARKLPGGGRLSVRQGCIARRALREGIAMNESLAQTLDPLRCQVSARRWRKVMKNAADYRRLLKAMALLRWTEVK